MSRILYLVALFTFTLMLFSSCGSDTSYSDSKPDRFLSEDTMIMLMAECYIAEGEIFHAPQDSDKQKLTEQIYSNIFHKYGISKEDYIANSNFYLKKRGESDELMKEVMHKVEEARNNLNSSGQ